MVSKMGGDFQINLLPRWGALGLRCVWIPACAGMTERAQDDGRGMCVGGL